MNKNIIWAKKYKSIIVSFKNLPQGHKMAIVWYNAIDGEAWKQEGDLQDANIDLHYERWHYGRWQSRVKALVKKSLPAYIKKYGNKKFGMVNIPTAVLGEMILKSNPVCKEHGWKNLKEMSSWYGKNFDIPNHPNKNRWPCILSNFDDETVQDGYHRLHCYIQQGARKIPCVFYVD